jgi:hypothetical protein
MHRVASRFHFSTGIASVVRWQVWPGTQSR